MGARALGRADSGRRVQVALVLPGVDAHALTAAARGALHSTVSVMAVLAMAIMRKGALV